MSGGSELDRLGGFLGEICPECGTPGPQRHLSAVGSCATCAANDPRPVHVPLRNAHAGVVTYDAVLPEQPKAQPWTPFRDRLPRPYCLPGCERLDGHDGRDPGACMGPWSVPLWPSGATPAWCYRLGSGASVHIKPGCRC